MITQHDLCRWLEYLRGIMQENAERADTIMWDCDHFPMASAAEEPYVMGIREVAANIHASLLHAVELTDHLPVQTMGAQHNDGDVT